MTVDKKERENEDRYMFQIMNINSVKYDFAANVIICANDKRQHLTLSNYTARASIFEE